MITVEEALKFVEENALDLGAVLVRIEEATGRILLGKIKSDRPFPPYDRVTMDGIAIRYSSYDTGRLSYTVEGVCPAGTPQMTLRNGDNCIEVMTGSMLPLGSDTVIRYEDLEIVEGVATIKVESVREGQNVHFKGSDVAEGAVMLEVGTQLSPSEISICASVGANEIQCKKNPQVSIMTTGDELVDIDASPLPHQVRKSNGQTIASLLSKYKLNVKSYHLHDDKEIIKKELSERLSSDNLIILSGGVSKGKFDFIPEVMEELGVQKIFHKVRQRPGKPLWFGRKGNCVIFGLPGNPVSSFVGARKYIYYWLDKTLGVSDAIRLKAQLSQDYTFNPDLHLFLPVRLHSSDKGELIAHPIKGNGSGDFISLKDADAIIELPRGKNIYEKGESYPIMIYRDLR